MDYKPRKPLTHFDCEKVGALRCINLTRPFMTCCFSMFNHYLSYSSSKWYNNHQLLVHNQFCILWNCISREVIMILFFLSFRSPQIFFQICLQHSCFSEYNIWKYRFEIFLSLFCAPKIHMFITLSISFSLPLWDERLAFLRFLWV